MNWQSSVVHHRCFQLCLSLPLCFALNPFHTVPSHLVNMLDDSWELQEWLAENASLAQRRDVALLASSWPQFGGWLGRVGGGGGRGGGGGGGGGRERGAMGSLLAAGWRRRWGGGGWGWGGERGGGRETTQGGVMQTEAAM